MHARAARLVNCCRRQIGGDDGGNLPDTEKDERGRHERAAAHSGHPHDDAYQQSSYGRRNLGVSRRPQIRRGAEHAGETVKRSRDSHKIHNLVNHIRFTSVNGVVPAAVSP